MNRKSLFSDQASAYARYRPTYPENLFRYLYSNCRSTERALDVATGNGQVASVLAEKFIQVDAIDISEKQLANAVTKPNITYANAVAEQLPFGDHLFDLVTVGQAAHWFELDSFYGEVNRVTKPGGILALLGYGMQTTNPQIDAVVNKFYTGILDGYWEPERILVDKAYRTLPFPYENLNKESNFQSVCEWDSDTFTGYLRTWSAVARYIRERGSDPVDTIEEQLQQVWGKSQIHKVVFPLFLLMARMN